MFRFDRSARSVVAVCTSCGAREVFLAGDGSAADNWAVAHVHRAHPERTGAPAHDNALTASRMRRRYRQTR